MSTATGQGRLKIGDAVLPIAFSVPAGPCAASALLPSVQVLANQVVDHVAARAAEAGHRVSCAKGCGACCRQMVPITPTEAHHLAALVDRQPHERADALRRRFAAAEAQMAEAGVVPEGHPDDDPARYREFGLRYFRQGVACPFLEHESCGIHPDRPLVCREYLVTSPPAACGALGAGQVQQLRVPLRVWAIFGRSTAENRSLTWMPLIEALTYAASHPPPPAERTGPQWVEAFLQEVRR